MLGAAPKLGNGRFCVQALWSGALDEWEIGSSSRSEGSTVTGKHAGRPSAYKHGGFSKTVLFPWEDAEEFEALRRSLKDELNPSGALEEEAVYAILTCIWRKRRIRDKRNLDTLAALQKKDLEVLSEKPLPFFDTKHEANIYALSMPKSDRRPGDDVSQLIGFSSSLYGLLEQEFLELMISMLGGEFSTHLEREVPREKYPTNPEWVQAVKREVDDVLLPRARAEMDSPDYLAAKAAEFITTDRILEDLDLEERLDAMADRAMRRLAQIKFMKQISATSETAKGAPLLQIEGLVKKVNNKK
jgi:hypothetical protein